MIKIINESLSENLDTVLVNKVITAINDEWKTIQYYNDLIDDFKALGQDDVVRVINDINEEEHKHVGQLTEVLRRITDNGGDIDDIYKGAVEGIEQLDEAGGY